MNVTNKSDLKTSIVCGVMDRPEHLRRALPTWLACPEVGEVVVVDWSSREPVASVCPSYNDPRVRIVRVPGQEHWVLSKCCNLGIRMATGPFVLRLDADDLLDPRFFAEHELSASSVFYRADPFRMLREEDVHLSGVVYAARHTLLHVNGYNERLTTYGCDDADLVARLRVAGISPLPLDFRLISHIPHSDELRTINQVVPDPGGVVGCRNRHLGAIYRSMDDNRRRVVQDPWGTKDRMATWCGLRGVNYTICFETKFVRPGFVEDRNGVFLFDTIRDMYGRSGAWNPGV